MGARMFRKSLAVAVILLFIGMCIVPSTAVQELREVSSVSFDGNTLYVGGTGPNNYTRIQDAINDAVDGDTVFVYEDSSPYYENVVVNNTINLIGENRDTTVIDANGIGCPLTCLTVGMFISGFTFQNSGEDDSGIYIYNNSGGNTINNTISGNRIINNNKGIYMFLPKHNIISHNIIDNNSRGLYLSKKTVNSDRPQIRGSDIDNNYVNDNIINANSIGIVLMWVEGDTIINNEITRSDKAIYVFGDGNFITNNDINYNTRGLWLLDTKETIISGNNLKYNEEDGINIGSSEENTIYNNNFSSNVNGIKFSGSTHNIISDNSFFSNSGKGIYLEYGTEYNQFLNNRFSDNNIGFHLGPSNMNNVISGNIFFNDGFYNRAFSNTYSNNMVNGKPFVYLEEESDIVLDNTDAGQIVLVYCDSITVRNHDLSNTTIGITLFHSNNCVISGNNLQNNHQHGIYMVGSGNSVSGNRISNNNGHGIYLIDNDNSISDNIISNNNNHGIYILGNDNVIFHNHIEQNLKGLYWRGKSNTVEVNNFILNSRHAYFYISSTDVFTSRWVRNYWGRSRITPKPIVGIKDIHIWTFQNWPYLSIILPFPWIGLDKLPASTPYTIEV